MHDCIVTKSLFCGFLVTTGPLPRTVGDIWHMVWQEKVQFIVMLTNLMEEKKKKCARYWPEDPQGSETYGQFTVTSLEEERLLHFVIRTLRVEVSLIPQPHNVSLKE